MQKRYLLLLLCWTLSGFRLAHGQSTPFNVLLEPITVPNLGGLQSYAFGLHNGQWLIIGGRLDGLHLRQPFASFDLAGHNNQLIVVDPLSLQKWSASLSGLPVDLADHLRSTNMQFHQEGNTLYLAGGYGYSTSIGDHTTFPYLTAVDVPGLINAVVSNAPVAGFFRQITDSAFQVTGGKLKKMNATYYLMGGQTFLGRYNPMGPTYGPGFVQEYTNAIRRFNLIDNGASIQITHLPAYVDSTLLHRRDYNAEVQILPDGSEGLTLFSGVFQPQTDLPFLDAVNVDSTGYAQAPGFQQYYNHYHCPVIPLYSAQQNEMHTLFFGGIAQFYDSLGILVQDNNIPFVQTIARVVRDANGTMTESKLSAVMPGLLGTGAEFIMDENLPVYPNHVIRLDQLTADTTFLGYIYGGINSTAPNIFWINTGVESTAESTIYKVSLVQGSVLAQDEPNLQSNSRLLPVVYPNPTAGEFSVSYFLPEPTDVRIHITNIKGQTVKESRFEKQAAGLHKFQSAVPEMSAGGVFYISIETAYERVFRKLVVEP